MSAPGPVRVLIISVAVLFVGACTASPGPSTSSPATGPTSASPGPTPFPSRSPLAVAATGVSIRPPRGGSFLVHGTYPRVRSRCRHPERSSLTSRYPGALSVRRAADGSLTLTVTLPFENYLDGIAEVPPSWPMAALEAQAIAARSYALASTGWNGTQGQTLRTPICATASCQVYQGIPVPPEPGFRRWIHAVRRTRGEVLLYEGRPADTVYFSTSNGRTYGNDQVFGSAPLPYLRPVVERDDGGSPESHWRVVLRLRDLSTFLRAAGQWPRRRGVSGVVLRGRTVVIRGHGATRSLEESTFRDAVNTWAPCLQPGRYPSANRKGVPLPVTVPSQWFTVSRKKHAVVLEGRGWGHGVGMVQWGAYGKARRGLSARQILAYYYGGLRPERYPEPGTIHVVAASGLRSLFVLPSKAGATLGGRILGKRRLLIAGGAQVVVTGG